MPKLPIHFFIRNDFPINFYAPYFMKLAININTQAVFIPTFWEFINRLYQYVWLAVRSTCSDKPVYQAICNTHL